MCGTPMVGHAVWVPGMMTRNKQTSCYINDVVAKPTENNVNMISQATPIGEANLDEKHGNRHKKKLIGALPC